MSVAGLACQKFGHVQSLLTVPVAPVVNMVQRVSSTSDDLRSESDSWIAYRTKNMDGYRVEGHQRVFYNFFLVPEDKPIPSKCLKKLVRADLDDSDPVPFGMMVTCTYSRKKNNILMMKMTVQIPTKGPTMR